MPQEQPVPATVNQVVSPATPVRPLVRVPARAAILVRLHARRAVRLRANQNARQAVNRAARALVSQAVRLAILVRAPARPAVSPVMSATTASPGAR